MGRTWQGTTRVLWTTGRGRRRRRRLQVCSMLHLFRPLTYRRGRVVCRLYRLQVHFLIDSAPYARETMRLFGVDESSQVSVTLTTLK